MFRFYLIGVELKINYMLLDNFIVYLLIFFLLKSNEIVVCVVLRILYEKWGEGIKID